MYNKTIEQLKEPGTKANWKAIKTDIIQGLPEWSHETPYQVRSMAIKEACTTVSKSKRACKEGKGHQTAHFRSRKQPKQSIYLPKQSIKPSGFYVQALGGMHYAEAVPDAEFDGRLVFEQGRWFLCLPETRTTTTETRTKSGIVALDPGVRTFQTYFSPHETGEIGGQCFQRIAQLCVRLDGLCSRISSKAIRARRRQNLRRAADRLRWKINDLIDELHWKTIRFLTSNFHTIVVPTFCATEMVSKSKRKIGRKSVRAMLTLSHGRFIERLLVKAAEAGCLIVRNNEAYTSKTCTRCGHINSKLGGNAVFRCSECGLILSRDRNGARNILLRALADTPTAATAAA